MDVALTTGGSMAAAGRMGWRRQEQERKLGDQVTGRAFIQREGTELDQEDRGKGGPEVSRRLGRWTGCGVRPQRNQGQLSGLWLNNEWTVMTLRQGRLKAGEGWRREGRG